MDVKFIERFNKVLEMTGGNKSEFARRINASPSFITEIVKGRTKPSEKTMRLIELVFGVSMHWLETGEGEMLVAGKGERSPPYTEEQKCHGFVTELGPLSADEYEMIDLLRALCPDQRKMAIGYLRYVANESRRKEETGGGSDSAEAKSA